MKIGSDPEFICSIGGSAHSASELEYRHSFHKYGFGLDGNPCTGELRPMPGELEEAISNTQNLVAQVCKEISKHNIEMHSGAFPLFYEPIGGHIHFELESYSEIDVQSRLRMDIIQDDWNNEIPIKIKLLDTMLSYPLNCLYPDKEAWARFKSGYGGYGSLRINNSHQLNRMEYRAPLSWLYSPSLVDATLRIAHFVMYEMDCPGKRAHIFKAYKHIIDGYNTFLLRGYSYRDDTWNNEHEQQIHRRNDEAINEIIKAWDKYYLTKLESVNEFKNMLLSKCQLDSGEPINGNWIHAGVEHLCSFWSSDCGETICDFCECETEVRYLTPRGDSVCEECFYEECCYCYHCEDAIYFENGINQDSEIYCQNCAELLFDVCENCNCHELKEEIYEVYYKGESMFVCSVCASDNFTQCEQCESELIEYDSEDMICPKCKEANVCAE